MPLYFPPSGETDINECESAPCQNKGECINLIGRYQCRCTGTGFDGVNCKYPFYKRFGAYKKIISSLKYFFSSEVKLT